MYSPISLSDLVLCSAMVEAQIPDIADALKEIVAIPSVYGENPDACDEAAQWSVNAFADACTESGIDDLRIEARPTTDGSQVVIGHRTAKMGMPTILLYSHYDVQPAGPMEQWESPPWQLTQQGQRWYGRGAADCKGNLVMHLAALRTAAACMAAQSRHDGSTDSDPLGGLGLRIVVEGSEEAGGVGLDQLVQSSPELFAADVILIADSGNSAVGVPTVTTSLRGIADVIVQVDTLEGNLHSGAFGGAAPDALAALISILASLRNPETGTLTIAGLTDIGRWDGAEYSEESFRRDARILDGVAIPNGGSTADLLWASPTITVTGIDCPSVDGAIAAVSASARARLNVRVPPGMDPTAVQDAVVRHLEGPAPWSARVSTTREEVGFPFTSNTGVSADSQSAALIAQFEACLAAVYTRPVVRVGSGGSIPLCAALQQTNPEAAIILFGVEDPAAAIHSPNESVDETELAAIATAEAVFLYSLATSATSAP